MEVKMKRLDPIIFVELICLIVLCVLLMSGCAYNSRNLLDVIGKDMKFSYGLIAIDHVNRVIILRETNAGRGDAPKPLPALILAPYRPLTIVEINEPE